MTSRIVCLFIGIETPDAGERGALCFLYGGQKNRRPNFFGRPG
jgi:hypothetical protein